jgi:PepSY-associated TM region
MPLRTPGLKKALIFLHRWMGVGFCLLFLLWFTSGIVMMYWTFPEVSRADRLNHAPPLDPKKIKLSPQEAYAKLQVNDPIGEVRLVTFDGRPAYFFRFERGESFIYADDGGEQDDFSPDMTLRIASAWARQPPSLAKVEENTEEDQWTVSGEFRELRPLLKYSWPDGEQVYVSTVTGQVVQYTTSESRWGAYLGAIPHWLYFTPLRRRGSAWSKTVIWASGLGAIAALLGISVGLWMYSPSKRFQHDGQPASIPYAGQKRWHMILGLVFGVLACTWTFSGMLSMDPFPQWQGESFDETGTRMEAALNGGPLQLAEFAAKSPAQALAESTGSIEAKELDLISFAGRPTYLAVATPNQTRIIPIQSRPNAEFDQGEIITVLRRAALPFALAEVKLVTEYEAYYLDRHHRLPLPVIFVRLNDNRNSAYYVDPKTARIVLSYNSDSRRNRWLYHGLHSIDFPWLYKHRPAWDILVLVLLAGGTSLCCTSVLIAWALLRKKLAPLPTTLGVGAPPE